MTTRYCGYRPYATQSLIALPPGQTDAIHSKYHHPFTATVPDAKALGLTESGRMSALASTSAASGAGGFSATAARPISSASSARSGAGGGGSAANTLSRSMYGAEFPNYFAEGPQLRAATEAELRAAFSLVDGDGSGVVAAASARKLLAAALHREPSRRQLDAIEAALGGAREISADAFVAAVAQAADALDAEVAAQLPVPKRGGSHSAGASEGQGQVPAPVVLVGPLPRTTFHVDLGEPGHDPRSRPVAEPHARGMYQTTTDLAKGTTRSSKHLPGYSGHVPRTMWGRVGEHGLGAGTRDFFHSTTNLAVTFQRRVPGYAGHVPEFYEAGKPHEVDLPRGQFAPTTTIAGDFAVTQHWDSVKAASSAGARA